MQTAYLHSPTGGAYLPTSQDNSIQPLPAVYLPNEIQISMVAAQPPRELGVPYDPAHTEQGYAQSQNFQDSRNFGISVNANCIRQIADSSGQQRDSLKLYFSEHLQNSLELGNDTGLSGQLSTDKMLAAGVSESYTDPELCDYVKERLAYLRMNINHGPRLSSKGCPNDNDSPLQSHCNTSKSNSVDCHPTSSTCDKEDVERQSLSCAVVEHCTAAATKALEEYSSKTSDTNAELTPKSKEKSETSASERILTEYPQIINEAAVTCTKIEEESPVVLTAMSGVTCDELTNKYPGLTLGCSSSQEESNSILVNADKDDRVSAVSSPLTHMTHKDRGDKGLKPVEVDDVESMIKDSKESWTPRIIEDQDANIHRQKTTGNQQNCPVSSKKTTAHSNSSVDRILINDAVSTNQNKQPVYGQTSCKNIRKDVSCLCSQVDLSNKYAECTPLSGRVDKDTPSVTVLKEPQYEDISDAEDMSELDTKLPEHEEFRFPLHLEHPEYEDISEDENPPIQNMDVEMPSFPPDVSEPNVKPYGHVQIQIKSILYEELIPMKQLTPKTETLCIAQHCSCPHFGETDDDTEYASGATCDCARHAECQTNRSCSPSSDLKDEYESDDEMNDDWYIIPLIISELKLELPEDEPDQVDVLSDVGEYMNNVTLCELHQPPPVQVPASAFSQIEVFDTRESFQQAKAVQFGKFPQKLSEESLPERDPKSHHSRRDSYSESEDSCETDDSCNYSPVEERNHLTVSMKLLNSLPASSSSEANDSESEKDHADDEARNLQNNPSRSRQNTCKMEDIIILNSDTEDECDQVCTNNARRQKGFFLQNEVSAAAPCSPQKRFSSETVASVCESVKENLFKKELLPAHSIKMTANSGQVCKNIAISEHVQHDVTQQNVSDDESVIVIDSDEEDDSSQNYKAKREFSSEWAGAGNDPFVQQQGTPVHTEYETAKGKLEECRQSADSSKAQRDSKHRDTHSQEEMQDTCSDLSHSIKRGQLPEAKTGSVCVQQKTITQMTSKRFHESDHVVTADKIVKKKAKTKRRTLSSEPGDSDSAFINVQKSPHVSNKSQKSQSSKDSSEMQPQSGTDREVDTTVGCNPVIRRLLIQNFPQDNSPLKLSKQSIAYRQDKDTTPKKHTSTSKNVDSCKTKTQLLHGDIQGEFVSNPKPADERHHVTPLSKSKESSSPPTKMLPLFKLQQPDSFSIPSTSIHSYTPTKGPSAMTQVTNKWRESYYSTRKDKKNSVVMEEGLRPKNNHDFLKEAKPRRRRCDKAPRRRNSSQESATPLMKRTMVEARELTKARNRDASCDQRHRVGEGYKWRK
ncbi:uncharacterized protein LOC111565841 isoform X2 [Amphiprion ocellaris]|uniref:uncharacterized protein LOC111565841 isoform X2 n=1 Tax=Amphiprion ocellaris TaxID=80972 RepID=UPI000C2FFF21|nr:uncharacterized protein LOC111565841 isoform X2 [Amphiprion ocellaris]